MIEKPIGDSSYSFCTFRDGGPEFEICDEYGSGRIWISTRADVLHLYKLLGQHIEDTGPAPVQAGNATSETRIGSGEFYLRGYESDLHAIEIVDRDGDTKIWIKTREDIQHLHDLLGEVLDDMYPAPVQKEGES